MSVQLVKLSRDAFRSIKKHTVGNSYVQSKVLHATENSPSRGSPFVSLSQRFEIAELSWDDDAFDEIVDILMQRLQDRKKWRKVVKALIVLQYCVQEGSGRFGIWCRLHIDVLRSLLSYEYTFDNEEHTDRGIEVRRAARKLLTLLDHPQYFDIRHHAEGAHLTRARTQRISSIKRRTTTLFRLRSRRSNVSAVSLASQEDLGPMEGFVPITIRQKVRNAVSSAVSLEDAMEEIKEIARRTSCPEDFMEILEAILEGLISEEYNKDWGQVFKALVLLRQCLANVSDDVAQHFQNNPRVMNLLRGFQDLGDLELIGGTANALVSQEKPPLPEPDVPAFPQAGPLPSKSPRLTTTALPPSYVVSNQEAAFSSNVTTALDEKRALSLRLSVAGEGSRPLPQPPSPQAQVDWSRLHHHPISVDGHVAPEKQSFAAARLASQMLPDALTSRPLPTPPHPLGSWFNPSTETLPMYDSEDDDQAPPLSSDDSDTEEDEDDIEYTDEFGLVERPTLAGLLDIAQIVEQGVVFIDENDEDAESIVPSESWVLPWVQEAEEQEPEYEVEEEHMVIPICDSPFSALVDSEVSEDSEDELAIVSRPSLTPLSIPQSSSESSIPVESAKCLTGLVHHSTEVACARGGYSDVYRGKLDTGDGNETLEDVAIKVLRMVKMKAGCSPAERMKKRMNREMSIWERLRHPHVVPLRGYAIEDDGMTPSLISPWFEHGDVLSYLERYHFADRRKLVRQVAEGLTYLHAQQPPVVHGDLKSGNVLIDAKGDAALCDFGLSILMEEEAGVVAMTSASNGGIGTLRWCAPELLNEDVPQKTLASDVWAFANLALEILTGKIPWFNVNSNVKVVHNIATGQLPSREDYPELPADNRFWEVLERCWRADPSERPTMEELRDLVFDDEMFSAVQRV